MSILRYTENTEGYKLIIAHEKSRHCRKAWKVLLKHFEGVSFEQRMAQEVAKSLKETNYTKPKRYFNIGNYYN